MKLFSNNIVPYASTEGDKIYPIVVDIKKGIKSGEAISFVTADNQVGVITVDFMDGNSSYSIEGCMVTSTIHRPDGTVLEIPCDIISQSTIEIPLGINGTYQEGVHTFDLKIVRGNGKVIGVPTMSYSVSGSLSSDDVVEGDDRLPVLTMVLDNAKDKLTRLDKAIAGATNDLEVKEARDGEVTLNARLERDLAKGKIHFVNVEGSSISTDSEEGYLENVEIHGNTWQDANNLSDIRSVGTKVEGQELYEIPVLSTGKNLMSSKFEIGGISWATGKDNNSEIDRVRTGYIRVKPNTKYIISEKNLLLYSITHIFYLNKNKEFISLNQPSNGTSKISFSTPSDCFYIRLLRMGQGTSTDIYIQLEEGTQPTPYEPYQEDKLTILSPTPLEKVGNVADRIICKDGVWGVEKNVVDFKIDNVNDWGVNYNADDYISFITKEPKFSSKSVCYSNKFAYSIDGDSSVEFVTVVSSGKIAISILKNKLDVATLQGFINWGVKENAFIKVSTENPEFIPLPHSQQVKLRTFADRTNISFLTEIEPTFKAQVPKSLGATVNTHTTQIDNLNKELDRVKKLEESTVSTVTTDRAFTTVAETTQGYFEDVKIEGKTLVNLNDKFVYPITNWSIGGNWAHTVYTQFPNIREGVTYTAIIYGNVSNVSRIRLGHANDSSVTQVDMQFNTPVSFIGKAIDSRGITLISQKTVTERHTMEELESLKLLILEGDHTDKDLSFFEGLKSVGQDSDEISVLSYNKNLLDLTKLKSSTPNPTNARIDYLDENNIKFTTLSTNTNKYASVYFDGFNFVPNVKYKFKCKVKYKDATNTPFFSIRDHSDVSKQYVGIDVKNGVIEGAFTPNHPNHRIEFFAGNHTGTLTNTWIEFTDIQLSLADSNFEYYTPVKEDKKQILYYNPNTQTWEKPVLREWDSIEKHSDGKYYYHKRSYEVMLDGSENWDNSKNASTTYRQSITYNSINIPNSTYDAATSSNLISDLLPSVRFSNMYNHNSIGISIYGTDNIGTHIAINNNFENETKLKQWLQANPITVVYQLAQEEVYECTNLDLITYQNETNLIVNSGAIQPKITLKVLSNVSNVVKLLQEKVSVLENTFIEGLKQVLSGNMMALAHLLYPEDFENNHEIQTLEL